MNKAMLWFQGLWSCFSWLPKVLWDEYLVDLHLKNIPWHPMDYIGYAERWNGRVAMIAVVVILQLELIYKTSIWEWLGVL